MMKLVARWSLMNLCETGWQKDFGGYTSYIAEGEDEEVS